MTTPQLPFRSAAFEKILRGASTLADAVRITLGPRSRCILIEKPWGSPRICHDAVTIAKEIRLSDPEENLGARMMREAAERTRDAVGDGTSTAVILAHAIFAEGLRSVAAGANAVELKRGLDRGARIAIDSLHALSRPVQSRHEKAQIAALSGHNDPAVGEIVADAIERVGNQGAVAVEEAKSAETTLEVLAGMQFDRGFLSPYFITDTEQRAAVLENPAILLCDQKISGTRDLLPLIAKVLKARQPLVVIAEDLNGDALAPLVFNKLRGIHSCAAVKAPGCGARKKALLQDIASIIGGQIAEEHGLRLASIDLEQLGHARRVIIDKHNTTVIGGRGDKQALADRCAAIRKECAQATSDDEREKLTERLAKLSSGVAVIHVGAPSQTERKSRREALADALSATKAAIAEGVVPGGGRALLRASDAIAQQESSCKGDERTGLRILKRALEAPARQIARNAAVDDGVVVDRMRNGPENVGFDAVQGRYVDLLEAGIIDPAKVVRVGLESAIAVASGLLCSEQTHAAGPAPAKDEAAARSALRA